MLYSRPHRGLIFLELKTKVEPDPEWVEQCKKPTISSNTLQSSSVLPFFDKIFHNLQYKINQ
jgi:hypothetical protein